MSLLDLIRERIIASGPITVGEYMELALSHPEYGYYMRGDPLGAQGDFITAPEISQLFGEMIGLWLCEQWRVMGSPQAALVELGPGRGTLMADMLRATKHIPGFHDAVTIHLVETSPSLKQKQWAALANKHPKISWHTDIVEIPQKPLLLIANEFFDALPVRQFIGNKERMIDVDGNGQLYFTVIPPPIGGRLGGGQSCSTENVRPHPPPPNGGGITEHSEPSLAIMRHIASHIAAHRGAALIVDYGYTQGSKGDTLQAVKDHHYHDPLLDPGSADLTAHVDFAALADEAIKSGGAVYGPLAQGAFLKRIGIELRAQQLCKNALPQQQSAILSGLERLISIDRMGDLFKCLCVTHSIHPKPEGF